MKKAFALLFTFLMLFCSSLLLAQKAIPVTNKRLNSDTTTFRFAIVSDRTGGMRAGVFKEAIQKLEIMQPEFVLSVGDLIDGYTEDSDVWNDQWDEFDAIVNYLSMPFYYVPGNHDTSNELLTHVWHERHGRDYYHFLYKKVLFIALNTDEIEGGGISVDQSNYINTILSQNTDVDWTLIFMHRPLWSYEDKQGYEAIEKSLNSRSYTLFSGHHHNYRYKVHNGMEHYTLATTGGGSWMRNPQIGELDHITWVTMKPTGPTVAHIDINGIYDKTLVPDKDYEDINALRQGSWLNIKPKILSSSKISELTFTLSLDNPTNRTLKINGNLNQLAGFKASKSALNESISVGEAKTVDITYTPLTAMVDLTDFTNKKQSLTFTASFDRSLEDLDEIQLETSARLLIDWPQQLKSIPSNQLIVIDGLMHDKAWENTPAIVVEQPQYVHEDWDWKGKDDGNFSFKITKNEDFLYVGIAFFDEKNIAVPDDLKALQDRFILHFSRLEEEKLTNAIEVQLAYSGKISAPLIEAKNMDRKNIQAAITRIDSTNQTLEIAIPISSLNFSIDDGFRFNVGIMDHDRPENTKPSVLWWRPIWGSKLDYNQSGRFIPQSNSR